MKQKYYHTIGWNVDTAIPTQARLEDTETEWVAEEVTEWVVRLRRLGRRGATSRS